MLAGPDGTIQLLDNAGLVGDAELLVGVVALAAEGVLKLSLGVFPLALGLCFCSLLTMNLEEEGQEDVKHDDSSSVTTVLPLLTASQHCHCPCCSMFEGYFQLGLEINVIWFGNIVQ